MNKQGRLELFHRQDRVDVSRDDARLHDLAAVLGFNIFDFAITDLAEIKARQEVFAYLLKSHMMDMLFANWPVAYNFTVPTNSGQEFLAYSEQLPDKTPEFWAWTETILEKLTGNLPERLAQALEVINQEKDDYFQEEKDLVEAMAADLTRSVVVEGILELEVKRPGQEIWQRLFWSELACCGVDLYISPDPLEYYQAPKWLGKAGRYYAQKVNSKKSPVKKEQSFQIRTIPAPILHDILDHFRSAFQQKFFKAFHQLNLRVYYRYDKKTLSVKVLDWKYDAGKISPAEKRDAEAPNFYGLANPDDRKMIDEIIIDALSIRTHENEQSRLKAGLDQYASLSGINAQQSSAYYCLADLSSLCRKYSAQLEMINNWHRKVAGLFQELYGYYQVIRKIKDIANCYDLPLVMPEVSDQGNVLEISQFAPVRLGSKRRIQPFSQFSVNGKMLNLTGRNGSGKTTVLLAMLDLCLMGQAGLPVFARKASLSIKKHFLLSFLERVADDSTFKAKLRKDMEVVAEIKRLDPDERKNVLAIVDELGSATTQGSVMSVVKPFADWLGQAGVSAILSTQIPELSQYMAAQLGVKNFKIGRDFVLEEGIGEGEPDQVAKEMGFFELLAKEEKP